MNEENGRSPGLRPVCLPSRPESDSGQMKMAAGIPRRGLSIQLREQLRLFTGFPFNPALPEGQIREPVSGRKLHICRKL